MVENIRVKKGDKRNEIALRSATKRVPGNSRKRKRQGTKGTDEGSAADAHGGPVPWFRRTRLEFRIIVPPPASIHRRVGFGSREKLKEKKNRETLPLTSSFS